RSTARGRSAAPATTAAYPPRRSTDRAAAAASSSSAGRWRVSTGGGRGETPTARARLLRRGRPRTTEPTPQRGTALANRRDRVHRAEFGRCRDTPIVAGKRSGTRKNKSNRKKKKN